MKIILPSLLNNLKKKILRLMGDSIVTYGEFELVSRDYLTGEITKSLIVRNKIVATGIGIFPRLITGSITNVSQMTINYCGIGTGETAPASGDTELETEGFRKAVSSSNHTADTATYSTYLTHLEGNMIINEVGMFINGSNSADSGTLFSRISTENGQLPYTKDDTETLTINYRVVFSETE